MVPSPLPTSNRAGNSNKQQPQQPQQSEQTQQPQQLQPQQQKKKTTTTTTTATATATTTTTTTTTTTATATATAARRRRRRTTTRRRRRTRTTRTKTTVRPGNRSSVFIIFLISLCLFLLKAWGLPHVYNNLGVLWYCNSIEIYPPKKVIAVGTKKCMLDTLAKRLRRILDGYAFRHSASTSFLFRLTCRQ